MERYCSTGQSPQRAVAPTEEEEEGCICYIEGRIVVYSISESNFVRRW